MVPPVSGKGFHVGVHASPHGFVVLRGRDRGYRPDQVDRRVTELSAERDEAWERTARLTVLAREMADTAERLRVQVAQLAPQTYETLGARAREILAAAEAEALELRDGAEAAAQELREEAEETGRAVRDAARAAATEVRAQTEARARAVVTEAQRVAGELRSAVRREVKELRGEALAALHGIRQRTVCLLADQEKEHQERWEAAGRDIAERETALESWLAERADQAEARLVAARRAHAEAAEAARHSVEDAQARAAELLAQARARADRAERETERALREHQERCEELTAHLERVSGSLPALLEETAAEGDAGTLPGPTHS
jgi:hypothetical protein